MNDDYIIEQTKSILIDSLNKSRLPSGVLIYILRDILKQLEGLYDYNVKRGVEEGKTSDNEAFFSESSNEDSNNINENGEE